MLALKREKQKKKSPNSQHKRFWRVMIGVLLLWLFSESHGAVRSGQARPSDSPGLATIVGGARLVGRHKGAGRLAVYKNLDFCGATVADESLLVDDTGRVENVAITIHGTGTPSGRRPRRIVLDNRACRFVPHVQVALVGSEVLLENSDPILHDVHARMNSETLFNVGLPAWRKVTKTLTRPGIVAIHCDVLHTWMSAYIVVTSSPYFAVTGKDGRFAIEGVPAGEYEVEFWHERLGRQSRKLAVHPGEVAVADVVFIAP